MTSALIGSGRLDLATHGPEGVAPEELEGGRAGSRPGAGRDGTIGEREDERGKRRLIAQDDAQPDGHTAPITGGDGRLDDLDQVTRRVAADGLGRRAGQAALRGCPAKSGSSGSAASPGSMASKRLA